MRKFAVLAAFLVITIYSTPGLFAQQKIPACPCCDEEYKQFDFWVGDWVVYAKGKMAGYNKITKIEDGCVLRENWKSFDSSYSGSSYNFYDKVDKKWKQVWIDNQGTVLELSGRFENGRMVLQSKEKKAPDGNNIINRITWYENDDGTVRQLWEQSNDGGIAFTVAFDGLYRRRK